MGVRMAEQVKDAGRSLWYCQRQARGRRGATRHARHPGVPGHEADHLLTSLLVRSVAAAPAAELAQLDSIRAVSPRLVGLVVAALAVFACKRHRDAYLSASHFSYADAVTEKRSGRRARRNRAKNSVPPRLASHGKDPRNAKAPRIRAPGALQIPNRPQLGPEPSPGFPALRTPIGALGRHVAVATARKNPRPLLNLQ